MRRQRTLRVSLAARFALMCPSLRQARCRRCRKAYGYLLCRRCRKAYGDAGPWRSLSFDLRSRLGGGNKDCSAASPLRSNAYECGSLRHALCLRCRKAYGYLLSPMPAVPQGLRARLEAERRRCALAEPVLWTYAVA